MKIQFIVSGWWFNQESLFDGLEELEKNNDFVSVFFTCHKEPTQKVKDTFTYKVFPNVGLGDGAYDQALDHLKLEDDTVIFFMHDDIIIKDWSFMNICIAQLGAKKFVGNGFNYPADIHPNMKVGDWFKNDTAFWKVNQNNNTGIEEKTIKEVVKEENQWMFDEPMTILTLRPSFMCTTMRSLHAIGQFEPMGAEVEERDGKYHIKGYEGYGGIGNLIILLYAYKINRIFGRESIGYLASTYLDTPFIYECARGKIDEQHKMT